MIPSPQIAFIAAPAVAEQTGQWRKWLHRCQTQQETEQFRSCWHGNPSPRLLH